MTPNQQIIQHSDGRLYLVEYIDPYLISAVYAECGQRLCAERHPEFKQSLTAAAKLNATSSQGIASMIPSSTPERKYA